MKYAKYLVMLGGLIAIIGQFWGSNYYLPVIGGVIALFFAFGVKDNE